MFSCVHSQLHKIEMQIGEIWLSDISAWEKIEWIQKLKKAFTQKSTWFIFKVVAESPDVNNILQSIWLIMPQHVLACVRSKSARMCVSETAYQGVKSATLWRTLSLIIVLTHTCKDDPVWISCYTTAWRTGCRTTRRVLGTHHSALRGHGCAEGCRVGGGQSAREHKNRGSLSAK